MTSEDASPGFGSVIAFVEELARAGVRHVCVAPGSRSTPLALAIAEHPDIRVWMHVDERSTAYFALGMAKATGEAIGVLCTSGTAAANLFPAVVEAHSSSVPLLVMTADRPPELREVGAAQTIDQHRLFGGFAKWFVNLELQSQSPVVLRHSRTIAGRAVAAARATPAGPVHLNFPFRDPLTPTADQLKELGGRDSGALRSTHASQRSDRSSSGTVQPEAAVDTLEVSGRANVPWVTVSDGGPTLPPHVVEQFADVLRASARPIVVCGPQPDEALAEPLAALAALLRAPLLADPLSQLRWGPHDRSAIVDRYDTWLRHPATAASLAPDVVVRIGSLPTSKTLLQFIEMQASARVMIVDPARWPDPTLMATDILHADPAMFATALLEQLGSRAVERDAGWLHAWREADAATRTAVMCHSLSLAENFEGRVLAEVSALIPSGGTLFVSNSMPVRDLDAFAPGDERRIRVLGNRGTNGIDGVVSTALGVAAASRRREGDPVVLVIGDLAFYHDMNGLLAARQHGLNLTVVLVNNDGGGIFSFLSQTHHPHHFEQLFGTPHGLEFEHAARMYDARYTMVNGADDLRESVSHGISTGGLHIVEVRTDRQRNVELHREAHEAAFAALEAARTARA